MEEGQGLLREPLPQRRVEGEGKQEEQGEEEGEGEALRRVLLLLPLLQ